MRMRAFVFVWVSHMNRVYSLPEFGSSMPFTMPEWNIKKRIFIKLFITPYSWKLSCVANKWYEHYRRTLWALLLDKWARGYVQNLKQTKVNMLAETVKQVQYYANKINCATVFETTAYAYMRPWRMMCSTFYRFRYLLDWMVILWPNFCSCFCK